MSIIHKVIKKTPYFRTGWREDNSLWRTGTLFQTHEWPNEAIFTSKENLTVDNCCDVGNELGTKELLYNKSNVGHSPVTVCFMWSKHFFLDAMHK